MQNSVKMEMLMEDGAVSSIPAPETLGMEELLLFLSCEKCQRAARNPKLLPCLHTLCAECLEENKPIGQCPTCRTSSSRAGGDSFQDNLFFVTLQAKLDTYKKITSNRELVCNRCRDGAEFWCSECEEFLCKPCYNAHQWYLKQKSHEVQKLCDLKSATPQDFLEGAKKSSSLFCSEPTHNSQLISIYCYGCHKPLCCSCALLDGEHYNAKLYCDIRAEIRKRKAELSKMKEDLAEKKRGCERTRISANERLEQLERVRAETRNEIQEKVEEMVQWIQGKGEELLADVDGQLCQEREEVERKLQRMDHTIKRMEASELLVEKMNLFASDQEVMEMHPFIWQSLEELRKERLPSIEYRGQVENFVEAKGKLRDLLQRVKGENDAVGCLADAVAPEAALALGNCEVPHEERRPSKPQGRGQLFTPTYTISITKTSQGFATSITSPGKRAVSQREKGTQASPKMMKLEDTEDVAKESSSRLVQESATGSRFPLPDASTPERQQRRAGYPAEVQQNSPFEICESEANSIVISSSEENEDDCM